MRSVTGTRIAIAITESARLETVIKLNFYTIWIYKLFIDRKLFKDLYTKARKFLTVRENSREKRQFALE